MSSVTRRSISDQYIRQLPFAIARALTQTAQDAQRTVQQQMPQRFDRPKPFTIGGIGIRPATKARLESAVLVKPVAAQYLGIHEKGGSRVGSKGDPLSAPVHVRTDAYGNIPRQFWAKARQLKRAKRYVSATALTAKGNPVRRYGGGMFVASGKDARTAHLHPGIYERPMRGTRRKGGKGTIGRMTRTNSPRQGQTVTGLTLLVSFVKRADYKARFEFVETVTRTARTGFQRRMAASLQQAVASARPTTATR